MEKDPFFNFISDLSDKIQISREHKQIMERVNSPESSADASKASLDSLILTIKQKIQEHVTPEPEQHDMSQSQVLPAMEAPTSTDSLPALTSTIIEVRSEQENNFEDFVGKLKNILNKPLIAKDDSATVATVSTNTAAQQPTSKYIDALKSSQKKDKPQDPGSSAYVKELDQIKTNVAIEKEDAKVTEIKKLIEEYAEKYIKKAVGMMSESGGGTNAVQYANGGIMNGDLNVKANYLSGGVNLLDIFALQPDLDKQTLSFNDANYDLSISGGNTVNLSAINTTFNANSSKYESAYTNLVTNSATYLSGSSDNKYFYKDINFTANASIKYSSGTRFGAITATLPSGVVVGDCIEFFDADGTWNTNSLIIDNNSYFIEGIYDRLSCNTRYGAFKLIYTGTDSVGWRIVPLPKHSVNSPTLASVTTNGQVISASSSQFNLIIDNTVDYFTFYINSTTQISLSNRYDVNNFANCSLSAFNATNVNIDTNPLFIQNTAILSSGSDNYYTLYYSNTGSSIVNVSYSQSVPLSLARDQVVIAYNQNSQESIDVANYYKNNRPIFSEVRTVGLDIPQAVYPARIASNGIYFCASGCDIDVPYEGCRKYDFISTSLVQTQIVSPLSSYINTYPATRYIVFVLDVPTLVIPDNIWGLSVLSATQIPYMGANVTKAVQLKTGIYPTYITGALSADCIAYIDKLKTATSDGITLYKNRNKIYTEDSYGAGYNGFTYYQYPETISALSAYSVYRSGAPTRKSSGQGLTGIFMDQSSSWPHDTGNIPVSSIAIWGTWGFNGRRYIAPNGPYRYNISGEGEVPGLSSMSYYTDPACSGKLSFTGPGNGWYFNYTIESWNGAPHGGAYGYFGGNAGNKFWGSFPTTYTGVKTFSAFKASAQYSRGLRPLRHSCYTQYFAKNAFGGTNYENIPVVWVGNSFEPFYPGAITNTFMRSWMEGKTAYATITGSIANSNPMVIIGDPLVKISLSGT